ncbi:hypothetical protein ACMDCR_13895 [Labrys okinawensis]|uniref:hypothetical protein n=1 Tax=Labrys okinawensis TaxID=346911 RepID=UPI0039BC3E28
MFHPAPTTRGYGQRKTRNGIRGRDTKTEESVSFDPAWRDPDKFSAATVSDGNDLQNHRLAVELREIQATRPIVGQALYPP